MRAPAEEVEGRLAELEQRVELLQEDRDFWRDRFLRLREELTPGTQNRGKSVPEEGVETPTLRLAPLPAPWREVLRVAA